MTVPFSHNVTESDITGCYFTYITKKSNLEDEFLGFGYSGRETGRLNITSRHKGWNFLKEDSPCLGGIHKANISDHDDGKYRSTLVLNNNKEVESDDITVNIYDGKNK